MPTEVEETELPSVIASFRTSQSIPKWLNDFTGPRFKVVKDDNPHKVYEVISARNGQVDLKGGKTVPVDKLRAVLPSRIGDLVVRISGEDRGQCWKVCAYGEAECVIYKYGEPTEKKRAPTSWSTEDLVHVFPPERGRRFQVA